MTGKTAPLGEVAEFINGAAFKPIDWADQGARIIRIQNLTDVTKPFNRTTRVVADKLRVGPGDLLVSWSATLGVFEWAGPDTALLNQHIFRVVPDRSQVEQAYLRHMLHGALDDMERHLHGATMKHVNRAEFLSTRIPVPPLEEQRRIATILDQADALRAKRREALAHLDDLTQCIFLDMFGHQIGSAEWPTLQLRQAVKNGTLVTYGIVQAGHEYAEGIPYIRTGDISNGTVDVAQLRRTDPEIARRFDRSRVQTGDIVMSIRATVGTTAMVPQEIDGANLTQGTARIAPGSRTLGVYLLHYLRSFDVQRWIQRQVKGATFREITLSRLRELDVALPPLDLQQRFALRVAAGDSLAAQSRAQGQVLDGLFGSLQSRAFAGRL